MIQKQLEQELQNGNAIDELKAVRRFGLDSGS